MRLFAVIIAPRLLLLLLVSACNQTSNKPAATSNSQQLFNKTEVDKQFIRANQQLMQKENDEMDYYEKTHKLNFIKTKSGIRYFVYKASAKGDSVKEGTEITMDFEIKLLDGTLCYSSKEQGKKTFLVEHEQLESGIHRGVQYLKRGDKALLLLPSPLAHGLLGDMNKIPPQTPILYDVKID